MKDIVIDVRSGTMETFPDKIWERADEDAWFDQKDKTLQGFNTRSKRLKIST